MDPVVEALRGQITAIDRQIFRLVNDRLQVVAQLKRHKEEQGYEFVDPEREQQMVEEQLASNQGPLSPEGLKGFYAVLLMLTKRETG